MASRQRSYATTKKLIVIMATTDPRKGDELGVPIFQAQPLPRWATKPR